MVRTADDHSIARLLSPSLVSTIGPAAPAAPQWTARFVALQLDLIIVAATFFGLAYGLGALSMGTMAWAIAAASTSGSAWPRISGPQEPT